MQITLSGRIDSTNAAETENRIASAAAGAEEIVLDAKKLEYISSAGLRVLLRIRKTHPELRIRNVSPEVYDILEMTGFTEMMQVERAYREVSIEGCEQIGRGANGTLYRLDRDTVVKVYNPRNTLADIQNEREMAKLALILGIPTAISYDVVKVGERYGSVFELLNARSFSKILARDPGKLDWCVKEFAEILKKMHAIEAPEGRLSDVKETVLSWAEFLRDYLPAPAAEKLVALVSAVPHDRHLIHGDYHTSNLELQNGEVLLIDMDTLSVGNPIFELGSTYNAFVGFSEWDSEVVKRFHGIDDALARTFWHKALSAYLGTTCESKIKEVEDKARIVGYTRLIRRSVRRGGLDTEEGRAEIECWRERLLALLDTVDTLMFDRDTLVIDAEPENLDEVQKFVEERLASADCAPRTQMQIALAVEEIFVNIASYAYAPDRGKAKIRVTLQSDPAAVTIEFADRGVPYDPLAKEDPDVTLSAQQRRIGGLGVFLTKKSMDDVRYEYRDGQNVLSMTKRL